MENIDKLYEAILKGNLPLTVEMTKIAIEQKIDPKSIIDNYMSKAMEEIGTRFENGKAFVPELLMSSRAMKGALELLKPLLIDNNIPRAGTIVIGTVKGDLHDIGKNLVASMLEGSGFEVVNLGVDISSDKFVTSIVEHKANILCLSALLTTTMNYMKNVIHALEEAGIRNQIKIMVGGAPVNSTFAEEIGADGYSSNANAAVAMAKQLLAS
ncbi:MAG: corrinoid protein [Prevotellaceae bacterium]|jgi:corrinoid protein of di/trimethylamine methyltransferase|nr:corrinoid protein [Prevotellaceae bacterium]